MTDTTLRSRSHPVVTRLRKVRDGKTEDRLFVEGRRLIEELLRSPLPLREAAVTPAAAEDPRTADCLREIRGRGVPLHFVAAPVMEFLSDLDTPPGLIVCSEKPAPWDFQDRPPGRDAVAPFVVLLDGLQSSANVGAVLRSAEAAEVDAVGLLPGTADALSPKSLRASAGSAFRLPLFRIHSLKSFSDLFQTPPTFLVADATGSRSYTHWDWRTPSVLVLGGEARGVPPASFKDLAVERVRIPMAASMESLNVAVAAGILLMEARRQRQEGPPGF